MALEIERKFLVCSDDYKRLAYARADIRQGYIAAANGRTVRIRLRRETLLPAGTVQADKAFLTIKGPSDDAGLSRYEFETEVPVSDGNDLMHIALPGVIDKTRWLVRMADGHIFEVDEFHGANDGLVVAEVELGSDDESFALPDFIDREVTGDRRYYNSHLCRCPYQLWPK
jgi:CYTH domain-containing protein